MTPIALPIDVADPTALDGAWSLRFEGDGALVALMRRRLADVWPRWGEVGERGGFPASHARRGESRLRVDPLVAAADGSDATFVAHAVDARALQVLRSTLLARAARKLLAELDDIDEERIAGLLAERLHGLRMVVQPHGAARSPAGGITRLAGAELSDEAADDDLYPPLLDAGDWPLAVFAATGKLRRCVVGFADDVDAATVTALAAWIEPWTGLLEAAGFEQPNPAPGVGSSHFGNVQLFDSRSVEIVVDCFEADEGAWSTLLNMVSVFGLRHRVAGVELY